VACRPKLSKLQNSTMAPEIKLSKKDQRRLKRQDAEGAAIKY
jgi:hypothetical protein